MGIREDLLAFEARLDTAIQEVMENEILSMAKVAIINSLFQNVYSYESPAKVPYERRYDKGGLADPDNIQKISGGQIANGYEIEVADLAKDQDGFPVAEIIESGEGYHWENSYIYQHQPYPRPFYEPAEKMIAEGGWFANELKGGLKRRGFLVVD